MEDTLESPTPSGLIARILAIIFALVFAFLALCAIAYGGLVIWWSVTGSDAWFSLEFSVIAVWILFLAGIAFGALAWSLVRDAKKM
jgi:hypothetical protein